MNKTHVYALCFGAFLVGILVSALVSGGLAYAAPSANPHTAAPLLCPGCTILNGGDNIGSRLAGKNLSNAVLPNLVAVRANFTGTDFSAADLYGWTSSADTARYARFVGADLRAGNINQGDFTQANFTNALLMKSLLSGTNFSGANFTGANLTGVNNLGGNVFTGAIWSNTTCADGTNSNADGGTCIGHL